MVNYNENAIREAAYYIWQNAGCPQGQDEKFWSMAVKCRGTLLFKVFCRKISFLQICFREKSSPEKNRKKISLFQDTSEV